MILKKEKHFDENSKVNVETIEANYKAAVELYEMGAISEVRPDVSKYAPKQATFRINPDKIRDVIGQGGKTINEIIAQCDNVKIDIEEDGRVVIYHQDREAINKTEKNGETSVRRTGWK